MFEPLVFLQQMFWTPGEFLYHLIIKPDLPVIEQKPKRPLSFLNELPLGCEPGGIPQQPSCPPAHWAEKNLESFSCYWKFWPIWNSWEAVTKRPSQKEEEDDKRKVFPFSRYARLHSIIQAGKNITIRITKNWTQRISKEWALEATWQKATSAALTCKTAEDFLWMSMFTFYNLHFTRRSGASDPVSPSARRAE